MDRINKYEDINLLGIYVLGTICIFFKCCLFNYYAFEGLLISSIVKDPVVFWSFYLPKISVSLFFALLIFVNKKKSLFVILLLLLDIWCIANLCYMRSCGFLIDVYAFSMINNMDGFWTSSFYLLETKDLLFPLSSILYILIAALFDCYYKNLTLRNVAILLGCVFFMLLSHFVGMLCLANMTLRNKIQQYNLYNELFQDRNAPKLLDYFYIDPFRRNAREVLFFEASDFSYEVKNLSIFHSPGIILSDLSYMNNDKYEMTQNDIELVNHYIVIGDESPVFNDKLIVVLLESFENWVVSPDVMPNLYGFIENNDNILYATKISPQIAQGSSSDGQLIINTGLLPIRSGATVFRFPLNKFPNVASLANGSSAVVLPHGINVWNQRMMSPAYGYDTTFVCGVKDEDVFEKTIECINDNFQVVQVLTISSHAPFDLGSELSNYNPPKDAPLYFSNYLKCFSYTDSCLLALFDKIKNDSAFRNATLVITGDHTILTDDKRYEYAEYCKNNELSYNVQEDYCPLIIYSSRIKSKKIISEKCYQMDIFPTLLSILDCKSYYWKGFGHDLFMGGRGDLYDVNTDSLVILSDKIIRSDYFSTIK